MIFLKSVLIDFYNCCEIPIRAVDNNMNILSEVGYSSFYDYIFNDLNLNSKFERSYLKHDHNDSLIITFENNISFYSLFNYKSIDKDLIFIIGPLYLKEDLKNSNDDLELYKIPLKTKDFIEKNYAEEITIDSLCTEFKINKSYFCNIFKSETGQTFINFLNNYRIEKSKDLLKDLDLSLLDIAHKVGFSNQSYYCTVFKKFTGLTPLKYREDNYKKGL